MPMLTAVPVTCKDGTEAGLPVASAMILPAVQKGR